MERRAFLSTVVATGSIAIAGCSGGSNAAVDETVTGDTGTFRFDAESGQTITATVENQQGHSAHLLINDPDGDSVVDESVETEDEFTATAESTGAYSAHLTPLGQSGARASVRITLED